METVWGKLKDIDTEDFHFITEVLRWDKRTVVEGFIAENLVEQILE